MDQSITTIKLKHREKIRICIEGREDFLQINGDGQVHVDHGKTGSTFNLFEGEHLTKNEEHSIDWKAVDLLKEYLELLVKVQQTGHNIPSEIEETLNKIKQKLCI